MFTDDLMYSSKLEVKRQVDGKADHRHDLAIDPAEEALFPSKYMPAGLVFSRDATGKIAKIGCVGNKIPFFLFNKTNTPMASLLGAPADTTAGSAGGYIGGGERMNRFYSGMGHFEVSTTEYKKDDTYAVDDPLYAAGFATPATYDALAGRVRKGAYNTTQCIIGVVSQPCTAGAPSKNVHSMDALHFTACFIPYRADPA